MNEERRNRRQIFRRRIAAYWTLIGVGLIVAGCATYGPSDGGGTEISSYLALSGAFAIVMPWAVWVGLKVGGALGDEIRVAGTAVPHPAEIARSLEHEWGRPASIEEVAAVHQMFTSRKSTALLATGIGLGALFLINRDLESH